MAGVASTLVPASWNRSMIARGVFADMKMPYQEAQWFIRGMVFTPDGKRLATANGDSTVYLLDTAVEGNEKEKD